MTERDIMYERKRPNHENNNVIEMRRKSQKLIAKRGGTNSY
jgi:hypothetical protein